MKRNCLVTGGAGFIGSHIVDCLLEEGHTVRVVDNFTTGTRENIKRCENRIELIEGDISDSEIAHRAIQDVDIVFHQAAVASVPRSVDDPIACNAANIDGTLTLLVAAKNARVRRFIYAGSSSAYGNSPQLPKREDMPSEPLSPYAISKLAGEMYCQAFHSLYGLETVVLRYFNVFGPRQDPTSEYAAVIPKFVVSMLDSKRPIIYGDGLQSRDFSYVENSVIANMLAADAHGAPGQVINVACGKAYTLLDLIGLINKILGTNIEPEFLPARQGDVKHSVADISRAHQLLGYRPRVSLEEGLSRVIEWLRQKGAGLS